MLSDDEIRVALFASGLHKSGRTMFTRWKNGIGTQLPVPEIIDFARAVERAAYERAAQECEEWVDGNAGRFLVGRIRALGRQR